MGTAHCWTGCPTGQGGLYCRGLLHFGGSSTWLEVPVVRLRADSGRPFVADWKGKCRGHHAFGVDDLCAMLAADSEVAKDLSDTTGARGWYRTLPGRSDDGSNVDLLPGAADAHVAGSTPTEAHAARVWRGARYQHIRDRVVPWFAPSAMVLKARLSHRRECTAADRSAAALVEGGWFPPARLHALGLRAHSTCRRCGKAAGTLWHRMGTCGATESTRCSAGGCPPWLLRKGSISLWDPLFTRGVPALPKIPAPPPDITRWGLGGRPSDGALAKGDVYSDGAVSGRWRRIMRAGWGLVALAEDADAPVWATYGTLADVNPSVIRSELRAVLEALRIAMPPRRLHVDNAEVVYGWRAGRAWCVDPARDGADLWVGIWNLLEDIGGGVDFVKVKAHTDEAAVEEGIITSRDRIGNALADRHARLGARLGEALAPTKVARAELTKAIRWLYWSRRVAAVWCDDIAEDEVDATHLKQDRSSGARGAVRGAGVRHLVWERGGALMCRRCGRIADTATKRRTMQSSQCLGSAAGRLLARTCNDQAAISRQCVHGFIEMTQRGWRPRDAEDVDPRTLEEQGVLFVDGSEGGRSGLAGG